MASPQTADGFTSIANELMDAIIGAGLGKRELTVLLYILRKTYGYKKKADAISYGSIARATGIERRNVMKAVTNMTEMGVITVEESGVVVRGQNLRNIGINKDYEQWRTGGQSDTGQNDTGGQSDTGQNDTSGHSDTGVKTATSVKSTTRTSGQNDTSTSVKTTTHKRKPSKENQQKKGDALFERWYQRYPRKVAKGQARRAFAKLNPDEGMVDRMIEAVEAQKRERAQAKAAGEWVPEWKHPATWINAESWEDEPGGGGEPPEWMREAI